MSFCERNDISNLDELVAASVFAKEAFEPFYKLFGIGKMAIVKSSLNTLAVKFQHVLHHSEPP